MLTRNCDWCGKALSGDDEIRWQIDFWVYKGDAQYACFPIKNGCTSVMKKDACDECCQHLRPK